MSNPNARRVIALLEEFDSSNTRYAVVRDIENALPKAYLGDRDVDIIIHPEDKFRAAELLQTNGWLKVLHPYDNKRDFVFLYRMDRFEFYVKGNAKLDICYQLACRSTNAGEWVPLDQEIQESVWLRRERDGAKCCYVLDPIDECVHLLARAFFDKRVIPQGYRERISDLFLKVGEAALSERLRLVFFSAAPVVVSVIKEDDFDMLHQRVLSFVDY